MYISKITIENIRGIENEVFNFTSGNQAGWHILLGNNGSGKSTILRAIALALIGPNDIKAFRLDFREWLRRGSNEGSVSLSIIPRSDLDKYVGKAPPRKNAFDAKVVLRQLDNSDPRYSISEVILEKNGSSAAEKHIWSNAVGWFAAGFGPFRRFTGGEKDWETLHFAVPRSAALLSLFGENVALTQTLGWLTDLHHGQLDGFKEQKKQLELFKKFINETGLLPQNTRLSDVNSRGVFFIDGNDNEVEVTQLSDGFRTVLSMTFELIRQMIRTYGIEKVFRNWTEDSDSLKFDLPGVVLIDEVDVHLHPTWQIEVGEWFVTRFPAIQFIVTTHSPLICRAARKSNIWKLAAPGSSEKSRLLNPQEKARLVLGNILDAFSTGVFGNDVTQDKKEGQKLTDRLAELSKKSFKGTISNKEKQELQNLRAKLPTVAI